MIYWCAIYKGELKIADRLDLCEDCLRAVGVDEEVVPYDYEREGVCERCGRLVEDPYIKLATTSLKPGPKL